MFGGLGAWGWVQGSPATTTFLGPRLQDGETTTGRYTDDEEALPRSRMVDGVSAFGRHDQNRRCGRNEATWLVEMPDTWSNEMPDFMAQDS